MICNKPAKPIKVARRQIDRPLGMHHHILVDNHAHCSHGAAIPPSPQLPATASLRLSLSRLSPTLVQSSDRHQSGAVMGPVLPCSGAALRIKTGNTLLGISKRGQKGSGVQVFSCHQHEERKGKKPV